MIDALAILIDPGRIDPTKYIEMECGIQHRCKDELFSSLMRSLNASQSSLCAPLSHSCSFTMKLPVYLYSSVCVRALRCSERHSKVKAFSCMGLALHMKNTIGEEDCGSLPSLC